MKNKSENAFSLELELELNRIQSTVKWKQKQLLLFLRSPFTLPHGALVRGRGAHESDVYMFMFGFLILSIQFQKSVK